MIHTMFEAIAKEMFSQNYDMVGANPQLDSVKMQRAPNGGIRVVCKATYMLWMPKPEKQNW